MCLFILLGLPFGFTGANDVRGVQPGPTSIPCAMSDLCVYVPQGRSLAGIGRFYDYVLGAPSLPQESEDAVSIIVSPQQTLTFKYGPKGGNGPDVPPPSPHEDLERDEQVVHYIE